jgi:hypothetical protein
MIVVFDTNIWKSNLFLQSPAAAAVRYYLKTTGARVGLGLMCIHYDQPEGAPPPRERYSGRRCSSGEAAPGKAHNCLQHPAGFYVCIGDCPSPTGHRAVRLS